jgi:acylphosphatase
MTLGGRILARKRIRAVVQGRVQGVFFRAYTQEEAQRLGLVGWVRNRPDGTVEAVAEGEAERIDQLFPGCARDRRVLG